MCHKFIRSLPKQIAPVIAAHTEMPLVELGRLSDNLMPLIENAPVFQTVESQARTSHHGTRHTGETTPVGLRPYRRKQ